MAMRVQAKHGMAKLGRRLATFAFEYPLGLCGGSGATRSYDNNLGLLHHASSLDSGVGACRYGGQAAYCLHSRNRNRDPDNCLAVF